MKMKMKMKRERERERGVTERAACSFSVERDIERE